MFAITVAVAAPALALEEPSSIKPVPTTPMPGEFTFAAVGDLIYLRPMLATLETQSPDMMKLLRGADVTFGNFEMQAIDLAHFRGAPQAESGGTWLIADPRVVDDVKAMGFDVLSLANNHTTDWGVEGLAETEARLKAAGLISAGTGRTLQAARSPRYHDGSKGRVALVATSSTFTPMSRAADPIGEIPGRPGLNPLRVDRIALVSKSQLAVLGELAAQAPGRKTQQSEGTVRLLGAKYRAIEPYSGKITFSYEMDEQDLSGNLLAVRQGKQNSNFMVFAVHNHEPGNDSDVPADFAITLARRAIDEGADAYVGHGPHILRGIEIYKGKPIFYSLGNFAMMNNSLDALPRDMYEQYAVEPGSRTVPELLQARAEKTFADPRLYESVIAVSRYVDGRVAEIRLYPIDLGVNVQGAGRGVPRLADPTVGRRILERLQSLSKPFGTEILLKDGVGIIRIP
ncbi:CapA family protein [Pedomonas mirosovicensis]|uniref:CapA family protein n=1 Tax=Pedomonas mirosovicensis TaxID=2908641 RepID=UPI00286EBE78|nr:CapA family protein [Pedomonas mirosovicensis]